MNCKGNCLGNALIENFFGHLKSDPLLVQTVETMSTSKEDLLNTLIL